MWHPPATETSDVRHKGDTTSPWLFATVSVEILISTMCCFWCVRHGRRTGALPAMPHEIRRRRRDYAAYLQALESIPTLPYYRHGQAPRGGGGGGGGGGSDGGMLIIIIVVVVVVVIGGGAAAFLVKKKGGRGAAKIEASPHN